MNDTAELQNLIDNAVSTGQKHIFLPPRVWVLEGLSLSGGPCVSIPPGSNGIQIHGAGRQATIFRMADNSPRSTRSIYVQGSNSLITDCTFEGGVQTDNDEHRAGIFVMAPGFRAHNVESVNHTGDGFYLYNDASDVVFDTCLASSNHRNGVTFGGMADSIRLLSSQFLSNGAQQVDTEPGSPCVVSGLLLQRCKLDAQGVSEDYVLTLGGAGPGDVEGHDISVIDCELNGGVYMVWGKNISLSGCYGVNNTKHSSVELWRTTHDVNITRCSFKTDKAPFGILVTGTGENSSPKNIRIEDSYISCASEAATGISLSGVQNACVERCKIKGSGIASSNFSTGIEVRSTLFNTQCTRIELKQNRIESFSTGGIVISGNARPTEIPGKLEYTHINELWCVDNSIGNGLREDGVPLTSLTKGMILDDGSGVVRRLILSGNIFDQSISQQFIGATVETLIKI